MVEESKPTGGKGTIRPHLIEAGGSTIERQNHWRHLSAAQINSASVHAKRGLVEGRGFEPPTPTLRTSCSPN